MPAGCQVKGATDNKQKQKQNHHAQLRPLLADKVGFDKGPSLPLAHMRKQSSHNAAHFSAELCKRDRVNPQL
jgi:hypothetical protein